MCTPHTYWEKRKRQSGQPVSDRNPKPGPRKQARMPSVRPRPSAKTERWTRAVSRKQQWHDYKVFAYFLTYLIPYGTYSMVQSPSSEDNPIKKFPAFHGTRRIITAFTSAPHLSLSCARSIQSMPPHPTSWRSILILSSHLRLGLPGDSFRQVSAPKPCLNLYSPHTCYMPRQFHSSKFYYLKNNGWGVEIIKLLIM